MTLNKGEYLVALFQSVSGAMKAEASFKAAGAPYKLIRVPKEISSECGICLRFLPADREAAEKALVSSQVVYRIVEF